MARRRKKSFNPEDQYILITSPAAYPRRWQGIRSNRPLASQVKGTMFEPPPNDTQMDLFSLSPASALFEPVQTQEPSANAQERA